MGSSSILNLPVLGQENQLLPTNRNIMKATESSRQLFRNEESKISSTGNASQQPIGGVPIYFSRQNAPTVGTGVAAT